MAGYWIVCGSEVKDQEALDEYARRWAPLAEKYSARFIVAGGRHETPEGSDCARLLIVKFPSYEQAQACYNDPDYQAVLPVATKAYDRSLMIVEGV